MNVKYNIKSNSLYFYLYGELDECSASSAKQSIDSLLKENLSIKNVVFNMSNLSFMDSTGIGMLLGRYKVLKQKNIGVYIENPTISIDKIMQISGLYEIMPKI